MTEILKLKKNNPTHGSKKGGDLSGTYLPILTGLEAPSMNISSPSQNRKKIILKDKYQTLGKYTLLTV